jgi:hypothetical protein
MTTDPDRRMRSLYRLRQKTDAGRSRVLAAELRVFFSPKLFEQPKVLACNGTALGEIRKAKRRGICRPMIRGTSAEGRLYQSIELDLNGAGKS